MKVLITVMVSILIYQNVFADSAKICIERWDDQIRNYNKVRKMYKNGADMFSKDPKSSFIKFRPKSRPRHKILETKRNYGRGMKAA